MKNAYYYHKKLIIVFFVMFVCCVLGIFIYRAWQSSQQSQVPPEPGTREYTEAAQRAKNAAPAEEEVAMPAEQMHDNILATEDIAQDVHVPEGSLKNEAITLTSQQLKWKDRPEIVTMQEEFYVIALADVKSGPWQGATLLGVINGGYGADAYLALQKGNRIVIALKYLETEKDGYARYNARDSYDIGQRIVGIDGIVTVVKDIDVVQLRYEHVVRATYHNTPLILLRTYHRFEEVLDGMLAVARSDSMTFDEGAKRYLKRIDYVHPLYGQAWITDRSKLPQKNAELQEGADIFLLDGIYFRSSANTPIVYNLVPDVVSEDYIQKITGKEADLAFSNQGDILAITWNDGTRNTQRYMYRAGGCGMETFVTGSDSPLYTTVNQEELVAVGRADSGRTIYTFRSATHPLVREAFAAYESTKNDMWTQEQMQKTLGKRSLANAQELLDRKMMIVFKDVFDRWHVLKSTVLAPPVECGKPVIYLYPQEPTDVRVQVRPDGGFTVTDPVYPNGGWRVHAQPSGQLTDLRDGATYPYLFWEGNSSVPYVRPRRGWIVARDELDAFFERTLAAQGLNARERADFRDFWVTRMQRNPSPYFFVTYAPRTFIDRAAPLAITPRPDTVIRVLMDYVPLPSRDVMGDVAPLPLTAPQRTGFTVVEWGGRLKN